MKMVKQLLMKLTMIAGFAVSASYALSGHLDITKVQTGTVGVTANGNFTKVDANGNWSLVAETSVKAHGLNTGIPKLSWVSLGKVARLDGVDPTDFVANAYTISGRCLGSSLSFTGNTVIIPGNTNEPVYLTLKKIKSQSSYTARSLAEDRKSTRLNSSH